MSTKKLNLDKVISDLADLSKYEYLYHKTRDMVAMPSVQKLEVMMEELKKVLFPGFFGETTVRPETIQYRIGARLEYVLQILQEQLRSGLCFSCEDETLECLNCEGQVHDMARAFIEGLPQIKHLLSTDVVAAFQGDPAAKNYGETIFSYPSILAMTYYRIAHALVKLEVPLIPRIITEMAHSKTGIDIHPGAQIGEKFFIDHGTGVVIGETSVIGKNVRLYQGVTLGAKSFPLDEHGKPIKGIPRHPIVEDDVTIYSNAVVLGRVTVGKGAVIGGNMWITEDVLPGATLVIRSKK